MAVHCPRVRARLGAVQGIGKVIWKLKGTLRNVQVAWRAAIKGYLRVSF